MIKNKNIFKFVICTGIFIFISFFMVKTVNRIYNTANDIKYNHSNSYAIVYTVEEADTVWSIARKFSRAHDKRRTVVDNILQTNKIDGDIHPGDKLIIPRNVK